MKIIFEDKHILAIMKEPNMPTQADKSKDISAYELAIEYIKKETQKQTCQLALMHRIDRPVGGVLIFSKTKEANKFLSKQIQNNTIRKKYYCICENRFEEKEKTLEDYITKLKTINMSKVVNETDKNAQKASMKYKVLAEVEDSGIILSLLEVDLYTGRHHQIRCQLSHIGHPIYGDNKYNKRFMKTNENADIALWSYSYSFYHQFRKDHLNIVSEIPVSNKPWSLFKKELNQL